MKSQNSGKKMLLNIAIEIIEQKPIQRKSLLQLIISANLRAEWRKGAVSSPRKSDRVISAVKIAILITAKLKWVELPVYLYSCIGKL